MPQETNLNVSPYFDDFDPKKDFHKVLFKPGYPVQSRELTTLQSILQNQIERFGQHFFKEGAKVIPGNTTYNSLYYAVQLNNTHFGVPVAAYAEQLVGNRITGLTSGVSAVVDKVLFPSDSETGNLTLYINYINSSTQNNSTQQFSDSELLSCNVDISSGLLGDNIITAGESFASSISNNSNSIGASFSVSEGVYFIRGNFINVNSETLILDQFSNRPNYRIGFFIDEQIVNSDIDESLADNSQGFNNYSAPGADRLKISVSLFKKSLTDFNDDNFIEIAKVVNGSLETKRVPSEYNLLNDELARRTYEESGDYITRPFDFVIKESLNDRQGNNGIFNENQLTYGGLTPSDNLIVYQLSPGKAYIRGYEVEVTAPAFLDVDKPRTTRTLENQEIIYSTGSTFLLNRVTGAPVIGVGNTFVLSLRDQRVGVSSVSQVGKEVGVARVYDFNLESGSYRNNPNTNEWKISLYDIQTITEITLNEPIILNTPSFVRGNSSGATGFLKDSVSSSSLITLYDTKGTFLKNESFSFDEIDSGLVSIAVTSYGISDIKSVYGNVGTGKTFTADVIQSTKNFIGNATVTSNLAGVSTVTALNIPNNVKVNDLISYTDSTLTLPVLGRVSNTSELSSNKISITGVTTVSGVVEGKLPTTSLNVNDLTVVSTKLDSSSDNTLYTRLPKNNISSVNIENTNLIIRKSFPVNITGNQFSSPVSAGENEFFMPFDEERYSLIRSDGSTEVLSSDRFAFISGGVQLQIYNLGANDTGATLLTTLRKIKPKSKEKRKNRVNSILIDKSKYNGSGVGSTTLDDGLTFGNYPYGTRVQDQNISLNTPDIIEIHGIYESSGNDIPSAPLMTISSLNGATNTTLDLVIGETIIGSNSGTVAIVAERKTNTQISFVYKNQNRFVEGETVNFRESNVQGVINSLENPSFDISLNYDFSTGQKGSIYDYGFITRKSNIQEPIKKIKVYFSSGFYDSSDTGDITTVNSYQSFDYSEDLRRVDSTSVSDIIDIRPRVSQYNPIPNNIRSPFEFYGRLFNASGNSSTNILASDESILTTFSFYLGRIDSVYLTKDGKLEVKYGTPSENPEKPNSVDEALELSTVYLPPYLYSTAAASVRPLEYKRYRMSDIKNIEDRVKNLEYYTALSLLETNTSNLFIPDSQGLNRFKSGFFVDNFTSFQPQEDGVEIKNSIDITNKELRPKHYTTSVDLIFGPVTNIDPNEDLSTRAVEGINVKKTGDIVTLDYAEVEWLKQPFATRTESVTPFLVSFWFGTMELTPSSDSWVDTVRVEPKVTTIEGNYAQTVAAFNVDPQTGFSPTVWDSWETNWTGKQIVKSSTTQNYDRNWYDWNYWGGYHYNWWYWKRGYRVSETTVTEIKETGIQSRTGNRTLVSEQFDNVSLGDRVVSRDLVNFMRSRNVQFVVKKIKPLTRLYAFFDGVDVTKYCIPKLLEISMVSGTFEIGENVVGLSANVSEQGIVDLSKPLIRFRVAQTNHKEGSYNLPSTTFSQNPYTNQSLPANYSSTSNILNIDTFSLSNNSQGEYSGWIESGMRLVGETSGSQATITNVRLVSDLSATLMGSFYIPNPNIDINPRFESGSKVFVLVNDENNNQNTVTTLAEETFTSSGILETTQENMVSIRNARIENQELSEEQSVTRTTTSSSTVCKVKSWYWWRGTNLRGGTDPLAQSFLVDEDTGIFLTRCDVFFKTKDDGNIPVTFQLRTMQNGLPTQTVIPLSEIVLEPDQINISDDGSVATPITLKSPVYLEGGKEHCICLLSNSTKYSVYISRVGENDTLTDTFISNQPYLGSLFKSQNASTWEPSQWEDLKFTLYRADFIESGTVQLYSPELSQGNNQIATLLPNSLSFNSKKIRIGIGTTLNDSGLVIGNTIFQSGTKATGNYIGNAGIATGTLNVINAGIGYTPSSGSSTYNNINLVSITGSGRDATANITISSGVAIGATVVNGGYGYQVGDVLGISSIGSNNVGTNARFSVSNISNINELVLDNVQGDFVVGASKTVSYVNSLGITTDLNQGGVFINTNIRTITDGLHIKVNHKNHGMYFSDNIVELKNVSSDILPTKLTSSLDVDSNSTISVEDSSNFSTFENVTVDINNLGYLLIENEVISYTSVSTGSIGGTIVRGANGVNPRSYPVGTPVYKYELNGVSLNRINTFHSLNDVTIENAIDFDSYHIKIDMTDQLAETQDRTDETSYPKLFANQTKSIGGFNIKATQNISYEIITPQIHNLTTSGTSISAQFRSISGKSIDSTDGIPYVDLGTQQLTINSANYLNSTRLIASKINENNKLSNLVGNKSLNINLNLETTDSRITPVIDSQRVSAIFTSNRVNNPIQDYANDSRADTIDKDPTATQYISKEITLENPASSIKILLSAYINSFSDVRSFYAISENSNFTPIFTPFPGYKNLDSFGDIINIEDSDGLPDSFVSKSNSLGFLSQELDFKEYAFTVDNLPSFRSYRIKLVLTSTNQVYVPRIRDLRVITMV